MNLCSAYTCLYNLLWSKYVCTGDPSLCGVFLRSRSLSRPSFTDNRLVRSSLLLFCKHHIRYFGRFPVSQFNDSLGGVDLKCTQWVQFRSTQPKLYFPKIMKFSHYNEYGVLTNFGSNTMLMVVNHSHYEWKQNWSGVVYLVTRFWVWGAHQSRISTTRLLWTKSSHGRNYCGQPHFMWINEN